MMSELMQEANAWFQSECGVAKVKNKFRSGDYYNWECNGKTFGLNEWEQFTIDDPRCRELCREKFKIRTVYDETDNHWKSYCFEPFAEPNRKSIKEAEIACLIAVYQERGM